MGLKRKKNVAIRTMQCKRWWQWGEEDGRGERAPQNDGGSNRKERPKQRAGRDVPRQDAARSGDDNRKAKLSARLSDACGGTKVVAVCPPDQGRRAVLGEKQETEAPADDRVRPGRVAPGRLRRPAPLGPLCQEESAMNPTEETSARGHQPEQDQLTSRPQCCLDKEWICRCCGTVWYKRTVKNE